MIKLTILAFIIVLIIIFALVLIERQKEITYKNTVSGIVLLDGEPVFNPAIIERELSSRHKLYINKRVSNEGIVILSNNQYRIVILAVKAEIPSDEIEAVCKISHIWKDALNVVSRHQSHIILSVSSNGEDLVELNLQFTKVAATLLRNTESIGIYLGNQSLISPKDFYLKVIDNIANDLPIVNWIYFGLRQNKEKKSGFTIGLKEFGFREVELVDSDKSFDEIYKILYDLTKHVLSSKEPLKSGETYDLSEKEKISLESKVGEFRDTESMHVIVVENELDNSELNIKNSHDSVS